METTPILLICPEEVICHIISFLKNSDLKNLRLTNKSLCASSVKPFGLAYFAERNHVVSEYSMDELLKITEHPTIGPYVKTIMLSGLFCMVKGRNYGPKVIYFSDAPRADRIEAMTNEARLIISDQFKKTKPTMEKAIRNIQQYQGGIAIGICDQSPSESFGGFRLVHGLKASYTYDVAGVLNNTVDVIKSVNCPLHVLKIDLGQSERYHGLDKNFARLQDALKSYLKPMASPFSMDLVLTDRFLIFDSHYMFLQEARSLKLSKSSLYWKDICFGSSLSMCYEDLAPIRIIKLHLNQCVLKSPQALEHILQYLQPSLESITFEAVFNSGVRGSAEGFTTWARWSQVLLRLSDLAQLKHCRLSNVTYLQNNEGWESNGFSYNAMSLCFPDGGLTFEAGGDDVSAQLRAVAAWVDVEEVRASKVNFEMSRGLRSEDWAELSDSWSDI